MTITASLYREVMRRSGECCEYCLVAPDDRSIQLHADHVISKKLGGEDTLDNLCSACRSCNQYKGTNIAALDPLTLDLARLYNPREQDWHDHFELNADMTIAGLTPEGRATIAVLRFNIQRRVIERYEAWMRNEYPCENPNDESRQ